MGGKLVLRNRLLLRLCGGCLHRHAPRVDIARKLAEETRVDSRTSLSQLSSTALAVFSDHKVGILRSDPVHGQDAYVLVDPEVLIVATGARESLWCSQATPSPGLWCGRFPDAEVDRDLIRATEQLFIVGGGNVGLIAGYHALQAGINVVGLVEALPECGGYKVHVDKLARLGVPIFNSHSAQRQRHGGRQLRNHCSD